jgi:hypothetical protein
VKRSFKHTLHAFDRIYVERIRRLFHDFECLFCKLCFDYFCCMYRGIILLENEVVFDVSRHYFDEEK